MIGRLAAIPLMLASFAASFAASAEDRQITLKDLLGADETPPVTSLHFGSPCGWATANGPCHSSSGFPLGGVSGTVTPNPLCDGDTCLQRSSRVIQPCGPGQTTCALRVVEQGTTGEQPTSPKSQTDIIFQLGLPDSAKAGSPPSPCDNTPDCSISFAERRPEQPPFNWTTSTDNPMIMVLGIGGCIVGPFKLFNHGQTILEIPFGVEYPAGCRERK